MNRRDPLFISGLIVILLLILTVSVIGRMFVFVRLMSTLLLLATLVFSGIVAFRVYKDRL